MRAPYLSGAGRLNCALTTILLAACHGSAGDAVAPPAASNTTTAESRLQPSSGGSGLAEVRGDTSRQWACFATEFEAAAMARELEAAQCASGSVVPVVQVEGDTKVAGKGVYKSSIVNTTSRTILCCLSARPSAAHAAPPPAGK